MTLEKNKKNKKTKTKHVYYNTILECLVT